MGKNQLSPPKEPLRIENVALRLIKIDDANAVVEATADGSVAQFTFMGEGLSFTEAEEWTNRSNEGWEEGIGRFAITVGANDAMVGMVGLEICATQRSGEIFYWLSPPARGFGYATPGVGLVAEWAFDENELERLTLLIHPENVASERVAMRSGFTREGLLRSYKPFKNGRTDMWSWSLLPSDKRLASG